VVGQVAALEAPRADIREEFLPAARPDLVVVAAGGMRAQLHVQLVPDPLATAHAVLELPHASAEQGNHDRAKPAILEHDAGVAVDRAMGKGCRHFVGLSRNSEPAALRRTERANSATVSAE